MTRPPMHTCQNCGNPCNNKAKLCLPCYRATQTETAHMSGFKRTEFGCIATFENPAGERLTLHSMGSARESVPAMIGQALRKDEWYRMISYSTPETILTDINGGRTHTGDGPPVALPEVKVLGLLKRPEMLHPRLLNRTPRGSDATVRRRH